MDASNADRTVEKLVLLRADSEARTEFGETALLLACRLGARESSVELLLRRGADVNVREIDEGYTPLHHASYWGNVAVVRCLLSHGAKPDVKENVDKETPFDWARSGRARLGTNEVRRQQYETILGLLLEISQSKAGE